MSKIAKKARNALLAETALAIAAHRFGVRQKPRRRGRRLLLGGMFAALGIGLFLKRDSVKALMPGSQPEAAPPPPPPPAPSNYDVGGPVANTATPLPAPDPVVPEPIDERAEEAAAAAEAANIGGPTPDYASADEPAQAAPEAEAPLAEAGEGESEGQEQADETIEAADNPALGETPEAGEPESPEEKPGDDWRTWSGRTINP